MPDQVSTDLLKWLLIGACSGMALGMGAMSLVIKALWQSNRDKDAAIVKMVESCTSALVNSTNAMESLKTAVNYLTDELRKK